MASRSERNAVIFLAPSDVEERGLARALQDDIKTVDHHFASRLTVGQQGCAPVTRHALQDRVTGVGRLILKVQPRHEVVEQPARKYGDADVRSLHALPIEWDRSRLDRLEPVTAILCCAGAAKPQEGWIKRRWPCISGMVIAAMRIGLPDFDHRIGYRCSV